MTPANTRHLLPCFPRVPVSRLISHFWGVTGLLVGVPLMVVRVSRKELGPRALQVLDVYLF